jgi:hypothetical protein
LTARLPNSWKKRGCFAGEISTSVWVQTNPCRQNKTLNKPRASTQKKEDCAGDIAILDLSKKKQPF